MNRTISNIVVTIVISIVGGAVLLMLTGMFIGSTPPKPGVAFSDFMTLVEEGKVADAVITSHSVTYHVTVGGNAQVTYVPEGMNVAEKLLAKHVKLSVMPDTSGETSPWTAFAYCLSFLFYGAMLVYQRRWTIAVERIERHFTEQR